MRSGASSDVKAEIAAAQQLDGLALDTKAELARLGIELIVDIIQVQLLDSPAMAADQQLKAVCMLGAGAGNIGVQRLDAMHKALLDQEIEGAVDGRGAGGSVLDGQSVEEIVGLQAAAGPGDHFEHASSDRGETHTVALALSFCLL